MKKAKKAKKSELTELKDKTRSELEASLSGARREQFKLKLVKSSGELKHPHKIKQVRRSIARLLTALATPLTTAKEGN